MKHGKQLRAAAVVLVLIAAIGIVYMTVSAVKRRNAKPEAAQSTAVQTEAVPEAEPTPTTQIPDESSQPYTAADVPVDFKALQMINPDIYAWVTIPETEIDYPVLQNADDNGFYLDHDYNKEPNENGSIFTETYNAKDFSDYMTVINGHNMHSGAMFAPLIHYMDSAYFAAHPQIIVYTQDAKRTYTIFAAYEWDDRHLLLNIDFSKPVIRSIYINYVFTQRHINSNLNDSVPVSKDDRILTLSCCNYSGDGRFLVQAVLTEELLTPQTDGATAP